MNVRWMPRFRIRLPIPTRWRKGRSLLWGWAILGFCLTLLLGCQGMPNIDSPETAGKALQEVILPKINPQTSLVSDAAASLYTVDQIVDPLPALEEFPLYGAQPSTRANTVYIEIFSSSEKANAQRQDERWLVDVADAFNAENRTIGSGATIQVGIRNVPSGIAARLLAEQAAQPTAYTPANELWLKMLESQGIAFQTVTAELIPNTAGFVVQGPTYQQLGGDQASFEQLLDGILGGNITVGYPNPYASSTALNLLYTLFWRGAGHHQDGGTLTVAELESPQVNSLFEAFQRQVLITTLTTLDLKELFIREPDKLQAFPLEYQSYFTLKQLPEFADTGFIPFGAPHNSPVVTFDWATPEQREALDQFMAFATAAPMQQKAATQGFEETAYLSQGNFPPLPTGDVLLQAQSYWKLRKDAGQTVYMAVVIDTSGSMEGDRLRGVQEGLRIASTSINPGNYLSLITFSDTVSRRIAMAPYDTLQQQRLLAAIEELRVEGGTAMYDGIMVGLADLLEQRQNDPNGRFYLLLLSDGEANVGYSFDEVRDVMAYSGVRFYPIAYGEVDQQEMQAIASLKESTVKQGNPENVQSLLRDLFQTNL